MGVGRQGVVDRIDGLEALLRYDRPDEKITRADRSLERHASVRRPTEDARLEAHRDELSVVVDRMAVEADREGIPDEGREWWDELVVDAREVSCTPATMVILELAVPELRTAPPIQALDGHRPYAVHGVLRRADQLRCLSPSVAARPSRSPSAS